MKSLFEPVMHLAEEVEIPAGTTLFQEGDEVEYAYLRQTGTCTISENAQPIGNADSDNILDLFSVNGKGRDTQFQGLFQIGFGSLGIGVDDQIGILSSRFQGERNFRETGAVESCRLLAATEYRRHHGIGMAFERKKWLDARK